MGLNLAGGAITGTPTQGGPFTFTIDVTDTGLPIGPSNCGGNRTYTVTVGCPTITVNPSSVPSGMAGSLYGPVQFMQSGGNGSITWSVTNEPTTAGAWGTGTFTLFVHATDGANNTSTDVNDVFIVDTVAPTVAITNPTNNQLFNAATVISSISAGPRLGSCVRIVAAHESSCVNC